MTMTDQPDPLLDLMRQCLRLVRDIEERRQEARGIEWQPSPRTIHESKLQGSALHHDPTGMTATDEKRLAVRDALKRMEKDLLHARDHLLAARGRAHRAVEGWKA
jgi:hypothetical protein